MPNPRRYRVVRLDWNAALKMTEKLNAALDEDEKVVNMSVLDDEAIFLVEKYRSELLAEQHRVSE